MRRAGRDRGRGPGPRRGGAAARASPPPSSTRSPRRTFARRAPSRRSRATRATRPPASASRSTTRSCTASRATGSIRDGQVVIDRRGRDRRRLARRRRPDLCRRRRPADAPRPRRGDAAGPEAGIAAATPGNRIWDISAAIEDVALPHGYGDRPSVRGPRDRDRHARGAARCRTTAGPERDRARGRPVPGHRADVHPRRRRRRHLDDGWTVATADGSLAAHFEDTIAVTDNGPEVLTRP